MPAIPFLSGGAQQGDTEETTVEENNEETESTTEKEEDDKEEEDDIKDETEVEGMEGGTAALSVVENVGGEDEEEDYEEQQEEGVQQPGYGTRIYNSVASWCNPPKQQEETEETEDTEETEETGDGDAEVQQLTEEKETLDNDVEQLTKMEGETREQEEEVQGEKLVVPTTAAVTASKEYVLPFGRSNRALSETLETFETVGLETGLTVWRLEEERDGQGRQYNFIKIPEDTHGDFYSQDCYLLLNTYVKGKGNQLQYDIHFWIGQDSSNGEKEAVAVQAVQLDRQLGGEAVQHREVEYNESKLFQSYFKSVRHMKGNSATGFNRVSHGATMNYKRFYLIKQKKKALHMYEVDATVSNMNHGDVFVLDLGSTVYVWFGKDSSPRERFTGNVVATNIVLSRNGFAKKETYADEGFWEALGAKSEKDVPTDSQSVREALENIEEKSFGSAELYRISDRTGQMEFTRMEFEGRLGDNLDSTDVFLVYTAVGIFIWEGAHANANEKAASFDIVNKFIESRQLSDKLPVTKLKEGQANGLFDEIMSYNRTEQEALKEETRRKLEGFKDRNLNIKVFEDFHKNHRGVEREVAGEILEDLRQKGYEGEPSKEEPLP